MPVIYTTPMCQEVVRLAGVLDYTVKQDHNFEGADLAIVLSETDTKTPTIKIKLNTFQQIYDSIDMISSILKTEKLDKSEWDDLPAVRINGNQNAERKKIKVKVYSNFIEDIVQDMGFTIAKEKPDFLVFPDYMNNFQNQPLKDEIELMGNRAVEIPSHKNSPLNPFERAKLRYHILESRLCTKP